MIKTIPKNGRTRSNGKQFLSPQPQPRTQTSSQHPNPPKPKINSNLPIPTIKETPPQLSSLDTINQIPDSSKCGSESSSSLTGSDVERQELLKMEIKQLKRENQFLKKKIQELMEQEPVQSKKKKGKISKGQLKQPVESLHLSVNYFFKEVQGLLSSVGRLFNLESIPQLEGRSNPDLEHIHCPIDKNYVFKKHVLSRKLQKLLLSDEDTRYSQLLDTFTDYYRYKEEAQIKMLGGLQELISRARQLNQWLFERAHNKKIKSEMFCQSQKETITIGDKERQSELLKIPGNVATNTQRMTFSPIGKKKEPYRRKIDRSPQ